MKEVILKISPLLATVLGIVVSSIITFIMFNKTQKATNERENKNRRLEKEKEERKEEKRLKEIRMLLHSDLSNYLNALYKQIKLLAAFSIKLDLSNSIEFEGVSVVLSANSYHIREISKQDIFKLYVLNRENPKHKRTIAFSNFYNSLSLIDQNIKTIVFLNESYSKMYIEKANQITSIYQSIVEGIKNEAEQNSYRNFSDTFYEYANNLNQSVRNKRDISNVDQLVNEFIIPLRSEISDQYIHTTMGVSIYFSYCNDIIQLYEEMKIQKKFAFKKYADLIDTTNFSYNQLIEFYTIEYSNEEHIINTSKITGINSLLDDNFNPLP